MNQTDPVAGSRWLGRRYLFRIAGRRIPSYTAMLALGCSAGVLVGAAAASASGLNDTRVALAMVALLVPALVGARLWFVLERWAVFRQQPERIYRRSDGGSALNGGLVLSIGLSAFLLPLIDVPFWAFWDAATFTMLVGLIFTRAGCLMNGCCAGRTSRGPLGMWLPNERGEWQRRLPTQLLEAVVGAVMLAGAIVVRSRLPFHGALFLGVLAAYGCARVLLEPMRERQRANAVSVSNIAFATALALGTSIVLIAKWPA